MIIQLYVLGQLHPINIDKCTTVKDIKVAISRKVLSVLFRLINIVFGSCIRSKIAIP